MPYLHNHNLYKKLANTSIFLSTLFLLIIHFAIVAQASPQQDISSQHIGIVSSALQADIINHVNVKQTFSSLVTEAVLNIMANGAEILGLLFGFILLTHAVLFRKSKILIPLVNIKLNRSSQFLMATTLILVGLAVPGIVNWLMSSNGCTG